jgi:uncharacterized protein YndB with AHSA1/START domain
MATTAGSKLKTEILSDLEIRMTRSFPAPKALVFETFTKCEHIARWWGPRRLALEVCELDFRVGGAWRFVQRDTDGSVHPFRGEFLEIVPDEVITQTFFYDIDPPTAPMTDRMVLTEEDGVTTVTITSRATSKDDLQGMIESGMEGGAAESYDRLEELLHELQTRGAN